MLPADIVAVYHCFDLTLTSIRAVYRNIPRTLNSTFYIHERSPYNVGGGVHAYTTYVVAALCCYDI